MSTTSEREEWRGQAHFTETMEMENRNGQQKHGKYCQVKKVTCIFNKLQKWASTIVIYMICSVIYALVKAGVLLFRSFLWSLLNMHGPLTSVDSPAWGSKLSKVIGWTSFCSTLNKAFYDSLGESSPLNRDTQEKMPLVFSTEAVHDS